MAPSQPVVNKLEVCTLLDVPDRNSAAFRQKQSAQIHSAFPPFHTGVWNAFVQFVGAKPPEEERKKDVKYMRFGVKWEGVKDRLRLSEGSEIFIEGVNGEEMDKIEVIGIEHEDFPCADTGDYFIFCQAVELGEEIAQVRLRISLAVDADSVKCICRGQGTRRFSDLITSQIINNARFTFSDTDLELWSDCDTLGSVSGYFKKVLPAGLSKWDSTLTFDSMGAFVESDDEGEVAAPRKRKGKGNAPPTPSSSPRANKKSKSETSTSPSTSASPAPPTRPFLTIIDESGSYSTYYALLAWIESGNISYQPLNPSQSIINPPLPRPSAIFHLAKFLDIQPLVESSLKALESQLQIETAATDLFGELSMAFEEVQEMMLGYAVKNWDEVKNTEGMKSVGEKLATGEGSSPMAAVLLKLMQRLKL